MDALYQKRITLRNGVDLDKSGEGELGNSDRGDATNRVS